jgi:hydrogenase/urease accessory protein HupE
MIALAVLAIIAVVGIANGVVHGRSTHPGVEAWPAD